MESQTSADSTLASTWSLRRSPLPFARGNADQLLEAFANVLLATEL